jgi:hypothetical protein
MDTTTLGNRPTLTFSHPEIPLTASVSFDRWDGDRPGFSWLVSSLDGSATGSDLRLGSGSEPTLGEALRCLLDFFAAFAESVEYARRTGRNDDNLDLFPETLQSAALAIGSDELTMIARDVVGSEDD